MRDRMFRSYKATEVHTSDPGRLILMLYDGAIRALELARTHAENRDHEGRVKQLNRVTQIVSELLACLDVEKGGSLANSLASLYNFVLRRIIDANIHNDPVAIEECLSVLMTLQDGWRQIVERPDPHRTPSSTSKLEGVVGLTA